MDQSIEHLPAPMFSSIDMLSLLNQAHLGVVIHRWDTSIVYANPEALQILRLSYEQLMGKDAKDPHWNFIDERNRRLQVEEYPVNKLRRYRSPINNELIGLIDSSRPETTWVKVNGYVEGFDADEQKNDGFIIIFFSEVTAEISQFSYRDIVEHAEDIVIVTEAHDIDAPSGPRIVYVNKAFEHLTGYTAAEVFHETPRILQGSLTCKEACARIRLALEKFEPVREQLLNYGKDGTPYWLDINIVPLRNRFGDVTHFAAIERDISAEKFKADQLVQKNQDLQLLKLNLRAMVEQRTRELRDANRKLEQFAFHDSLTGVPNRLNFFQQAAQQFARAERAGSSLAVGMIDIDFFKAINDGYGHDIGDLALKQTANLMQQFFRQEDTFGRVGGEEFAFCMVLQENSVAFDIVERLRIGVAKAEIHTAKGALNLTVSIGFGTFQAGQHTLDAALKRADDALYQAKAQGRNQVMCAANPTCDEP